MKSLNELRLTAEDFTVKAIIGRGHFGEVSTLSQYGTCSHGYSSQTTAGRYLISFEKHNSLGGNSSQVYTCICTCLCSRALNVHMYM